MDLHTENNDLASVLKSDRLTLRRLTAADAAVTIDALNHWEVTKWLTAVPFPYANSDFDWFLENFVTDIANVVWAIDAANTFVGVIGVKPDLGYWLHPSAQGRGIMTEAAMAAVSHHFSQTADPLVSGFHAGNVSSSHVLKKLGFKPTGIDRNQTTARGDLVDVERVILTKADWLTVCTA